MIRIQADYVLGMYSRVWIMVSIYLVKMYHGSEVEVSRG